VAAASECMDQNDFRELVKAIYVGRLNSIYEMALGFMREAVEQQGHEEMLATYDAYMKPQLDRIIELLRSNKFDDRIYAAADSVFQVIDCNNDGQVTMDEMKAYASFLFACPDEATAQERLQLLFNSVDADCDNKLSKEEVRVKAMQIMEAGLNVVRLGINIAAGVVAMFNLTIFKEHIDGCKMMMKLMGREDKVTKDTLKEAVKLTNDRACLGPEAGKAEGMSFNLVVFWLIGMSIARGATEADYRDGTHYAQEPRCSIL